MSFATFLYEEPEKLNFSGYPRHTVGFYTAKGMRSLNVMPESLKGINVFRIDGKIVVPVLILIPVCFPLMKSSQTMVYNYLVSQLDNWIAAGI